MSEDCSKIGCAVSKNAVQEYLNQYSLNQIIVTNNEFTAVINGVTYTIPAGTFSLPITSETAFPLRYQGCQSNVSVNVPNGSTVTQIQALAQSLLQQVASQQAKCNAASANPIPSRPKYFNTEQTVSSACTTKPLTISARLPYGVSQNGNDLICVGGIFASDTSQTNANSAASDWLKNLLNSLFSSGKAKCGYISYEPWSYFTEDGFTGSNLSAGIVSLTSPAAPAFGQASSALIVLTQPLNLHVNIVFDTSDAGVEIGTTPGGDDVFNPGSQVFSPYDTDVVLPPGSYYIGLYTNNLLGAGKVATMTLTPSHA